MRSDQLNRSINPNELIFISYNNLNDDLAELFKIKLEYNGLNVWKANSNIYGGDDWRIEIDSGIIESDIIIVLLTNNSSKSLYVTYEWAFALGLGKKILPILLKECDLHPRINIYQYLDFTNKNRPWEKLFDLISKFRIKS